MGNIPLIRASLTHLHRTPRFTEDAVTQVIDDLSLQVHSLHYKKYINNVNELELFFREINFSFNSKIFEGTLTLL